MNTNCQLIGGTVDTIPLFDIYSKNIFLIFKDNVYDRVFEDNYRLPDKKLIQELQDSLKKTKGEKNKSIQIYRNKLKANLEILKKYDMKKLKQAYESAIYQTVAENLTTCKRPSFVPYIKSVGPYYSKSELINLGKNMGLRLPEPKSQSSYLDSICQEVSKNDISSKTLIKHQKYIEKTNSQGIVRYYTFYGSYFMNKYLRNLEEDEIYDETMEITIDTLWKIIQNAPPLDQTYVVYRFVADDQYLGDLDIGQTYVDNSFVSCTRDPFYDAESNVFGFVLLKIKIPKSKIASAMCIESYSNFQFEQEILLPPYSSFRLDSVDKKGIYFHTNPEYQKKLQKVYEFTYMGNVRNSFSELNLNYPEEVIPEINFMEIKLDKEDLQTSLREFMNEHTNRQKQFKVEINQKEYVFYCNWFDSSDVYKQFFYIGAKNGFYFYHLTEGKIDLFIEIHNKISVGYYDRMSETGDLLTDKELVDFCSQIAYAFNIGECIIHPKYYPSEKIYKKIEYQDDIYQTNLNSVNLVNYQDDFYQYLKTGKKRFDNINDISPSFIYFQLDKLKKSDPMKILDKRDKDDLYQIYKLFKPKNLREFYLLIQESFFYKMSIFVDKFVRLYSAEVNPFANTAYTWKPFNYLYQKGGINFIPTTFSQFAGEEGEFGIDYTKIYSNVYRSLRKVKK